MSQDGHSATNEATPFGWNGKPPGICAKCKHPIGIDVNDKHQRHYAYEKHKFDNNGVPLIEFDRVVCGGNKKLPSVSKTYSMQCTHCISEQKKKQQLHRQRGKEEKKKLKQRQQIERDVDSKPQQTFRSVLMRQFRTYLDHMERIKPSTTSIEFYGTVIETRGGSKPTTAILEYPRFESDDSAVIQFKHDIELAVNSLRRRRNGTWKSIESIADQVENLMSELKNSQRKTSQSSILKNGELFTPQNLLEEEDTTKIQEEERSKIEIETKSSSTSTSTGASRHKHGIQVYNVYKRDDKGKRTRNKKYPRRLHNRGNECYMNSLFQLLSSTYTKDEVAAIDMTDEKRLPCILGAILNDLRPSVSNISDVIRFDDKMKSKFLKLLRFESSSSQEDPDEVFTRIMTVLSEKYSQVYKDLIVPKLEYKFQQFTNRPSMCPTCLTRNEKVTFVASVYKEDSEPSCKVDIKCTDNLMPRSNLQAHAYEAWFALQQANRANGPSKPDTRKRSREKDKLTKERQELYDKYCSELASSSIIARFG
jgi:hypothetical protein